MKKNNEVLVSAQENLEELEAQVESLSIADLNEAPKEVTDEKNEIRINIPTPVKEKSVYEKSSKTIAVYPYTDEEGNILYEIERRRGKGHPYLTKYKDEKGEIIYKAPEDSNWLIYNLPNVRKAIEAKKPIWIVEGESKADTLNKLGFVATTCAFKGTQKWGNYYNQYLEGAETLLIMVDNDQNSEDFAQHTAQTIMYDMPNVSIYIYRLNEIYPSIVKGGDINDLIEALGEEKTIDILETIEANH